MAKAGTQWLYDQLKAHPGFWLPPVKGMHYLGGGAAPGIAGVRKSLTRASRRSGRPDSEERDYCFLVEANAMRKAPRDLARYAKLFRYKGDQLSGDVCATYAGLKPGEIADVAQYLPWVKILLLVRDPVSRAWSRICMDYRQGNFDPDILEDEPAFREFLTTTSWLSAERSCPTSIVQRWASWAPNVQFRTFLLDDISRDANKARAEILKYIGADPEGGELAPSYNRKASNEKITLTDSIKAVLVEYFADELLACANMFGGAAREWPARYGIA
jgi:hypothetical protein